MSHTIKIPEWATNGPDDLEYRTYRMLSHSRQILELLEQNQLWKALEECDNILDFLYRYDSQRELSEDVTSSKLTNISWENIELVYQTGEQIPENEEMDELIDRAIETYEEIHSRIRTTWRELSKGIKIIQAGNRPYFISDGFALIITPDKKVNVYSFKNPTGYNGVEWRKFNLVYDSTMDYTPESFIRLTAEIKERDSDLIVYKVNVDHPEQIDEGTINVVSSNIFVQLRKDYGF